MYHQQLNEGELKEMLTHQEKADELGPLTSDIAVVLLDDLGDQVPSALVPTHLGIQSNHLVDIDPHGLRSRAYLLFLSSSLSLCLSDHLSPPEMTFFIFLLV
jgi:hypothetical protein